MNTHIIYTRIVLSILGVLLLFCAALFLPSSTSAQVATVNVHLEKKFSGPVPVGYTPNLFSFTVIGTGATTFPNTTVSLVNGNDGTADGFILLPIGTYTVTEVGPSTFVEGEWRPGWFGGTECQASSGFSTQLTISSSSLNRANIDCQVDNQWRFVTLRVVKEFVGTTTAYENLAFTVMQGTVTKFDGAFESDGDMEITIGEGPYVVAEKAIANYNPSYSAGCAGSMGFEGSALCTITNTYKKNDGNSSTTGTIVIEKQTIPDGNQTSFIFNPSWSLSDFSLSDNGRSTSTNLATGTHSIVETLPANWTQTSVTCSDGSSPSAILLQGGETVTCVFTNTLGGGGGGGDARTSLVFGYVWHDKNESDVWEKVQPNPSDDEVDLDGWAVQISNGTVTYATTTDGTGYYYFNVPAGTWTIEEVVQSGWSKSFPNIGGHSVTVASPITTTQKTSIFAAALRVFIPYTFAQSVTTYGPFDFGNFFAGNGGGGSGGGGGGSSGGGGSRSRSRDNNQSFAPVPQVLGESASIVPRGAPRTGAGGTAPVTPTLPTLSAIMALSVTIRRNK